MIRVKGGAAPASGPPNHVGETVEHLTARLEHLTGRRVILIDAEKAKLGARERQARHRAKGKA